MAAETFPPKTVAAPKEAAIERTGLGCDLYRGSRRRTSLKDAADLAVGLVCLTLFLGAVYFSERDSNYASSVRMTAAIQRAFGIHRSSATRASALPQPAAAAGKIILVAENDDSQRLIAKTALERYGYAVALADNGAQAVSLFSKAAHQVALVLLDQSALPASRETIRQLQSIRPDVRIILCLPAGETLHESSGPTGWIEKPFSALPLVEAVRHALASR